MSKRGQGEGSFRKRGTRLWEYRIRVTNPETGFNEQVSVTGATKDECRQKAAEVRASRKRGQRTSRTVRATTVGEWSQEWRTKTLPHSDRGANTIAQYDGLLRNHVEGTKLARVRLTALTGLQIETHIKSRDLAPSSQRSLHAALAAALHDAVRDKRLDDNPIRDAKRPRKPTVKRATQARALSDQEVVRILDATGGHHWSAFIVLALHTGLRRGELAGLRWSDIDLDARTLHVQRQATTFDDDAELKTVHSDRVVPLSETARAALIEHGAQEATRLATVKGARTDVVFTGSTGQPVHLRNVARWYATHARNAGVTDTGFHAFRHTFASRALAAGVPITDVSEWCGHADPAITLALYSWALPGDKRETIGLLDAHLGEITA